MTDKELYKATFAHLHASGSETRQEARHMKHGHIRKGVVVAAAAALTVTAAGAANVATDGALLESIRVVFTGEVTDTQVNPDGSTTYSVKGEDGSDIAVTIPEEKNEDGSYTTQYAVEGKEGEAGEYNITVSEDGTSKIIEEGGDTDAPRSVTVTGSVVGD